MTTTNKDHQRVATHEAGHVIAAVQLGIPVIGAKIVAGDPHFTRGGFGRDRMIAIEHLCLISFSGPAAERAYCGEIEDGGDYTDVLMAKNFIADAYEGDPSRVTSCTGCAPPSILFAVTGPARGYRRSPMP
jgi:hypothetical protein